MRLVYHILCDAILSDIVEKPYCRVYWAWTEFGMHEKIDVLGIEFISEYIVSRQHSFPLLLWALPVHSRDSILQDNHWQPGFMENEMVDKWSYHWYADEEEHETLFNWVSYRFENSEDLRMPLGITTSKFPLSLLLICL